MGKLIDSIPVHIDPNTGFRYIEANGFGGYSPIFKLIEENGIESVSYYTRRSTFLHAAYDEFDTISTEDKSLVPLMSLACEIANYYDGKNNDIFSDIDREKYLQRTRGEIKSLLTMIHSKETIEVLRLLVKFTKILFDEDILELK